VGFLVALALGAFALPALAANTGKQHSLDMQLSGTVQYWPTTPAPGAAGPMQIPAAGTIVFATIANQTTTGGNSTINSFVFSKPPGWTISGPFGKPAGAIMVLDAGGNLKVSNITGLQPKDVQGTHAITVSFMLTPADCSNALVTWETQATVPPTVPPPPQYVTVTTGTFSQTTFAFLQIPGMNQGTAVQ